MGSSLSPLAGAALKCGTPWSSDCNQGVDSSVTSKNRKDSVNTRVRITANLKHDILPDCRGIDRVLAGFGAAKHLNTRITEDSGYSPSFSKNEQIVSIPR